MKFQLTDMRALAVRALGRMYRPDDRIFAFRLRMQDGRDVLEGVSVRYTASVLIGLAGKDKALIADALHGQSAEDLCRKLIADIDSTTNMGDVAQIAWAARLLELPDAHKAMRRLVDLDPLSDRHPTVERAWALSACTAGPDIEQSLGERVAASLLTAYNADYGTFAHQAPTAKAGRIRAHVFCFADFVYPVMALADWGAAVSDDKALSAARTGANRMRDTQGLRGQWWWHFDARNGTIIEKYPVYSVHQDSMAPMALFAAGDACGEDYSEAIAGGMRWLLEPSEIERSLIDNDKDVIWRKVCRREPSKLTRSIQAGMSAISTGWRAPGVDRLFPPTQIDFESRPYHMGWILYVWSAARMTHIGELLFGGKKHVSKEPVADSASV
ncbi:MAG: hypothetical protein H6819_04720 [Phycisphaerales bacterium]|nr:hypothetical protein [Phycisphaerales bacterium]MCB9856503.1 hypothetical protein [Phycisphaerales bacterium]MCB9863984.1 hypothetical protein [Phycisphaerales bacterium]